MTQKLLTIYRGSAPSQQIVVSVDSDTNNHGFQGGAGTWDLVYRIDFFDIRGNILGIVPCNPATSVVDVDGSGVFVQLNLQFDHFLGTPSPGHFFTLGMVGQLANNGQLAFQNGLFLDGTPVKAGGNNVQLYSEIFAQLATSDETTSSLNVSDVPAQWAGFDLGAGLFYRVRNLLIQGQQVPVFTLERNVPSQDTFGVRRLPPPFGIPIALKTLGSNTGIPLRAVQHPSAFNPDGSAARWLIDVYGFQPGTIADFWQHAVVDRYIGAMQSVSDVESISLLPNFATARNDADWRLLLPAPASDAPISLQLLGPIESAGPSSTPVSIACDGFQTHVGSGLGFTAILANNPVLDPANPWTGFSLQATALTGGSDGSQVRLGSIDLSLDPSQATSLRMSCTVQFEQAGGDFWIPRVSLSGSMPLLRVAPGGQDNPDDPQFASAVAAVEASGQDPYADGSPSLLFAREPALLIPVPSFTGASASGLSVQMTEASAPKQNQQLTLTVLCQTAGSGTSNDVLVIDRNPFMVALARLPDLASTASADTSQIAQWSNSFPEGAGWRVSAGAGSFELLLPPQGVGEAMVTRSPGTPGEPQDSPPAPVDFRLAPPAQAALETSSQLQGFSEPGWNLRRILGYPGEQAPGAAVASLQFEMLYGLTCNVSTAGLKMSEMFSRLGGFAGPLIDAVSGMMSLAPAGGYTPYQSTCFVDLNESWGATYQQLLSRLGILELWNQERVFDLLLTDGVSYDVRTSANMAPPQSTDTTFLHGGLAYSLDPATIYQSILQNPHSSSAELINPRFSALGGYGRQRAGFVNDKVIVESEVAMGWLNSLSVTVIGRIGNLWHHAKHVTVYQRSVHPSRQFYLEQPILAGRPILRKVSEYVEIVQKARSYPESGSAIGCGFLQGAEFKSIRINVDSNWGTNIGSSGWSVPLWRRDAVPSDVYPRPQLLFQIATDPATGSDSAMTEMLNPETLCFYADLSTTTSSNTDTWSALEHIDFCINSPWRSIGDPTAPPVAQNDFSSEPGFGRFTYSVASDASQVNVVSQRAANAMSSALRNVTFMRAQTNVAIPGTLQVNADRLHDFVNNTLDELSTAAVAAVLANADPMVAVKARLARSDIQTGLVSPLKAACTAVNAAANTSSLRAKLADIAAAAVQQAAVPVATLWQTLFTTAKSQLTAAVNAAQPSPDSLKQALLSEVDGVFVGIGTAMGSLLTDLSVAGSLSRQLPPLFGSIVSDLGDLQATITDINLATPKFRAASAVVVRRCQDDLSVFLDDLRQLLNSATFLFGSRALSSTILTSVTSDLGAFCASLSTAFTAALATLAPQSTTIAQDVNAMIDKIKQPLPPAALQADLTNLAGVLNNVGAVANPFLAQVLQLRTSLHSGIQGVPTTVPADYLTSIMLTFSNWVPGDFNTLLSNTVATVEGQVSSAFFDLLGAANNIATGVNSFLDLNSITAAITQYLSGNDYVAAIESVRTAYVSQLDGVVQQCLDLGPDPATGVSSSLALLRAFGAPPAVPTLSFDAAAIAYFYTNVRQNGATLLSDVVQAVPVSAGLSSAIAQASSALGDAQNQLQQLGIAGLPTSAVLDRLVPDAAALAEMQLSDLFPNIAGLSLDSLFSGIAVPSVASDNIRISHQIDPQTLRASVDVTLNFPISTSDTTLFSIGPATVTVANCIFQAAVHIGGGAGQSVSRTSSGSITGDWYVSIAGTEIITFVGTALSFDESGHLHFDIAPARVRLAAVLEFLADFVESLDLGGGFSLNLLPSGIQCILDLPFPDMSFGAFGITNLSLGCLFQLDVAPFAITVGANLGQQEAPFTLTIFILGGAGWFEASVTYTPGTAQLTADVSIGILASASLSISLGPISGGVYIYFGITAEFHSSGGLDIGILIMIQGRVSLLGILDIDITLLLEAEYTSGGGMIGRGEVDASIKICWCFTLEVHKSVEFTFGNSSGGGSGQRALTGARTMAETLGGGIPLANDPTPLYAQAATNRINFLT